MYEILICEVSNGKEAAETSMIEDFRKIDNRTYLCFTAVNCQKKWSAGSTAIPDTNTADRHR